MTKQPLLQLHFLTISLLFGAAAAAASVDIAETSQIVVINATPNILLIVDNSSSMKEDPSGQVATACEPGQSCPAGAANPASKASIIKNVASELIQEYRGQVSLGLMAYQQYPLGTRFNDIFNNRTTLTQVGNRLYDVTYQVDGTSGYLFDANSTDMDWESTTKRYKVPHPNVPGQYIYYNIGIPGYQNDLNNQFCTTTNINQSQHFSFRCWRGKSDNDNRIPTTNSNQFGYSNRSGNPTFTLGDSPRARGVTHYGSRMVLFNLQYQTWHALDTPGLGYLHIPIQPLDDIHAAALQAKLLPQEDSFSANLLTNPAKGLIAAGLTPLEGTLYTAADYFRGQTDFFKSAQGAGNLTAGYTIPESCGNDVAIWLTDGMPSVDRRGSPLGGNPAQALSDAIAAAERFHNLTAAKLYIVGFAMPPTVNQDTLDLLAIAGKSDTAFLAENAAGLKEDIAKIFDRVIDESLTSAGVASTSTELSTDTAVFQSEMNTSNWSGELVSLSVASGGRDRDNPNWRAGQQLTERLSNAAAVAARNVVTALNGNGIRFTTEHMPASAKVTYGLTDAMINFMRGSKAAEVKNGGTFRDRDG